MLAPNDRFDGSQHTLIIRGGVIVAAGNTTPYGEAPFGSVAPGPVNVSFLLADPADPTDKEKRLPGLVFDDNQGGGFAGVAPHATADLRTWAQNAEVVVRSLDGTVLNADFVTWGIDATNTATNGIPFFTLSMTFSAFAALATDEQLEIQIWIRPTDVR